MTSLERFFQNRLLHKQPSDSGSLGPVLPSMDDMPFAANKRWSTNIPDPDKPILDPWKGPVTVKPLSDKGFELEGSLRSHVIDASGIDPKLFNPDWLKPGIELEPRLPELKRRRIVDASGDSSLAEVFEDGALKISFDPNDYRHLTQISINRFGRRSSRLIGIDMRVTAKDLETGEVIDLGTEGINPRRGDVLLNLKDKLEAIAQWSFRDRYAINVETSFGSGRNRTVVESFEEPITLIKPLQWGANHRGNENGNDLIYRDFGSAAGSGRIYQGRGGTDFLHLQGIRSSDVMSFNGRRGIDPTNANELGQQSFYGGTVFDTLTLRNGDELYLQGIERLRFSDVTIDLTPDLDDSSQAQWNTHVMDVPGAWRFNTGSEDVVIVSLDSGIAEDTGMHEEIDHITLNTNENNASSQHGHRAMSVMTAEHDDNDIAGIAPDNPVWAYTIVKSRNGETIFDAIDDAKSDRKDQRLVFQSGSGMGWGNWGATEEAMREALAQTADYGFFSASAGNDGNTTSVAGRGGIAPFQTDFDNVASVGALESGPREIIDELTNARAVRIASYSNRGANLTLVAPTDTQAIDGNGNVGNFNGTSAANPNLAGVAALVWSENTSIDGGELREILVSSAMDLGTGGFDSTFGNGLVNAEGAIRRAHALDANPELASFWNNDTFLA